MKEPTKEQVQKFWERCGVLEEMNPNTYPPTWEYPVIDLNNLFKYAVPKLDRKIGRKQLIELLNKWAEESDLEALDLFWAIWEVINDKPI